MLDVSSVSPESGFSETKNLEDVLVLMERKDAWGFLTG